jgi:2-oxoglutaroyl-CoA hydrolase
MNPRMSQAAPFNDPRLAALDGFRVEIDAARERADVILDRPPLNVVSMPQRDHLRLAFEALDDDARVRVIVLRAVGEHFSSGGNIKGFMEASPETVSRLAWNIAAPARCSKPVIAANRGFCFGVGFELSLACDFRLISETGFYALPEQRLGQIPGSGGSARLQKIVGITRTKDIVMRSRRIPAKQAYDWGIATECMPDNRLESATDALVDELRAFSPLAQRTAKKHSGPSRLIGRPTSLPLIVSALRKPSPKSLKLKSGAVEPGLASSGDRLAYQPALS